jgi:hypothetical protein
MGGGSFWKSKLKETVPGISEEILNQVCHAGLAQDLVTALKDLCPNPNDGCTLDPLLVLLPDLTDPHSLMYFDQGNYGLPLGMGGLALPIPAPPHILQPPNAFGRFIASIPGFNDRSQGKQQLFHCADLHIIHSATRHCEGSTQFRRLGPAIAALLHGAGAAAQPSFVTALVFNDVRSNPVTLQYFNLTA